MCCPNKKNLQNWPIFYFLIFPFNISYKHFEQFKTNCDQIAIHYTCITCKYTFVPWWRSDPVNALVFCSHVFRPRCEVRVHCQGAGKTGHHSHWVHGHTRGGKTHGIWVVGEIHLRVVNALRSIIENKRYMTNNMQKQPFVYIMQHL